MNRLICLAAWMIAVHLAAPPLLAQQKPEPAAPSRAQDSASAEQQPPAGEIVVTETVVVTATMTDQKITAVPAAVSVLTAQDLARLPARSLDDALRNLPGIDIAKMSGMAARGNSNITIRGVPGSRRALMLVDSMPANDLGFGSLAGLDLVPLKGLSQVEVVRGPFSSLYGANAFSGVFNVITRKGSGPVTVEPFAAGGNAGYYQLGFMSQGGNDRLSFSVTADRRRIDNVHGRDFQLSFAPNEAGTDLVQARVPILNQDYADVRVLGRIDAKLGERASLTILPRITQHEGGLGVTPRLPTSVESSTKATTVNLGSVVELAPSPEWTWRLRQGVRWGSSQLLQESFTTTAATRTVTIRPGPVPVTTVTPTVFPYAALTRSESDYTTLFVEPTTSWAASAAHMLTFGASYTREHGDFSPHWITDRLNVLGSDAMMAGVAASIEAGMRAGGAPNPSVTFTRDTPVTDVFPKTAGTASAVHNAGVFVQDEWTATPRLRIVSSARLDKHSEFGAVASPKLGFVLAADDRTTLRMSAGRAYRAPSLSELFGTIVFHGPIPGVPNPDLRPEFITAFDGGVTRAFGARRLARLEANVYFNQMKDLIQLRLQPGGDRFDWVNIARSRSAGAEWTLSGRPANWLNLSGHYGYTWTRDLDLGRALDQVPAHKVFLAADGARAFGRLVATGGLTWRWYDDRLQEFRGVVTTLGRYSRSDATASLAWGSRGSLGVTVQNLLDQEYQESAVNLAPGRMFSVSLNVLF